MDIEDLQDVAQLRVIVTMKEGHDSTLYGTGVLRACPGCVLYVCIAQFQLEQPGTRGVSIAPPSKAFGTSAGFSTTCG